MKKEILQLKGYYRYVLALIRTSALRDGEYFLPYKIYHSTLRPELSSTYEKDVKSYGEKTAFRWSKDGCGIASIKTAINSLNRIDKPDFSLPSITQMAESLYSNDGYLEKIGWKHKSLVSVAIDNNLSSTNCVYEHHLALCKNILCRRVPIASVTFKFRGGESVETPDGSYKILGKGGHLVVIKGFSWKKGKCMGFFIDDPQNTTVVDEQESNEYVEIEKFLTSYSEKAIYVWKN